MECDDNVVGYLIQPSSLACPYAEYWEKIKCGKIMNSFGTKIRVIIDQMIT